MTTATEEKTTNIGDIFCCSWGYEQTNVDFYQVTRVLAKTIELRKVEQEKEHSHDMAGTCTPIPDRFIGEPFRRTLKGTYVKVNDYSYAELLEPTAEIAGKKIYPPKYFSTYA